MNTTRPSLLLVLFDVQLDVHEHMRAILRALLKSQLHVLWRQPICLLHQLGDLSTASTPPYWCLQAEIPPENFI
ncbi:hypothetical protein COEREDRAFT_79347 [Coemansia reversa NRRL 1564]|uniref:Uncharacterized protein n=1 Tax=Coemansia reversa (strain ATCC 12441 / NRRL 1564) TaxID=763665 RepID=A0A2G5BKC1_COERN|nr:hypothetical protein COEREDRAFT_79347 [Coemansia reversa NRRL 1564]|eukprot:PIA19441.1 hypothetical protein COEREDRAFT_79347 [Coemansia reversa NRRL 1564]